jgi:hypothetical protein
VHAAEPYRRNDPKPTWWLLYLIAALVMAVLGLIEISVPRDVPRTLLESLAAINGFGLIGAWLRNNRTALEVEQERRRP